jgi:Transposase, Mutator family
VGTWAIAKTRFWRGFLTALRRRGLTGVRLVISDQHSGLVAALKRAVQGTAHQSCRVHFARNLLALVPKTHTGMVAAVFRTIFAQPDPKAIAATWDEVRHQLTGRFPKIGTLMYTAKAEVLAFTAFPRPHWPKIWSTNPLGERQQGNQAAGASWASSPTVMTLATSAPRSSPPDLPLPAWSFARRDLLLWIRLYPNRYRSRICVVRNLSGPACVETSRR